MMTSLDGRIDCAMTSKLKGVEDYYSTLDALNVPTTVSGRVTAELEIASGKFESKTHTAVTEEGFSKKPMPKAMKLLLTQKELLYTKNPKSLMLL